MSDGRQRIRTVKVNDRGQLVIPEDVRADLRITGNTTLVLIEREGEIVLRKEVDVLDDLEDPWREAARKALSRAWEAEDEAWDSHYAGETG